MILTAVANHVWQSTAFSVIAVLVVLTLRRQGARVRYWLWLAASVKFLISFSLLFALGRRLALFHSPIGATTKLQIAIDAISDARSTTVFPDIGHLWPVLLGGWLCGFLVVLLVWFRQWRRMLAVARDGVTLSEGREIESLRRVEHWHRTPIQVEIRLCQATLEPGVFGFSHPLLVWPSGISERLDDSQLDAILAHEIQHVRWNDNLTATVHMVVEALFWFHPLVWWLGARMMEERERACDEDVLVSSGAHLRIRLSDFSQAASRSTRF
jgi:bla regulator protein blaR1